MSTARERIEAATLANGELLVDPRLASADLEATETVSRHAAGGVIPKLCIGQTNRRFACIGLTRSCGGVVNGDTHFDGRPDLRRDTR